ncbi:universal stress protein [Maribacter sp. 2307ULW6-5]|uniref:universal stress protein n=1 Tax=Maribacter sp. 2307ULW6-5 TaxID=3386275 RepID=UPI0039BD4D85
MKSIVVPVDFSKQSENALKMAAKLAKKKNAELIVLHMLELAPAIMSRSQYIPQEQMAQLIKLSEKRFEEFLDQDYLKDLKVTPVIKHYKVFSEVNEVSQKHQADMVVMGSNGTDGLQEIFIGSNTERVVRHSEIPVLVVKEDITDFKAERFVFACDFAEENVPALKKAIDFAKLLDAELQLVYINTPGDAFLSTADIYERVSKFLPKVQVGFEVDIYNDYTVERGVLNYAESRAADIIGVPTHGRKGLSHFFMGSIGEDIANHSTLPVVTFKI